MTTPIMNVSYMSRVHVDLMHSSKWVLEYSWESAAEYLSTIFSTHFNPSCIVHQVTSLGLNLSTTSMGYMGIKIINGIAYYN